MTKQGGEEYIMALYEVTFIARPEISANDVDKLVETYSDIINQGKGLIIKTEHWGLRDLAYIINKSKKGHFVMLAIDAPHEAIKEMADLDSQRGMTGKAKRRDDYGREVGAPIPQRMQDVAGSDAARALDDTSLAADRMRQAQRMEAEARGLLAESARLKAEAEVMAGIVSPELTASAPKKRGRKAKVVAANAA